MRDFNRLRVDVIPKCLGNFVVRMFQETDVCFFPQRNASSFMTMIMIVMTIPTGLFLLLPLTADHHRGKADWSRIPGKRWFTIFTVVMFIIIIRMHLQFCQAGSMKFNIVKMPLWCRVCGSNTIFSRWSGIKIWEQSYSNNVSLLSWRILTILKGSSTKKFSIA